MPNLNHLNAAMPTALAAEAVKYTPIPRWCRMTGMSRSGTYVELGRGNLRAIKLRSRILIDVEHGLAWLATCPAAVIRAPKSVA